jgi:hypothetical protein
MVKAKSSYVFATAGNKEWSILIQDLPISV